MQVLASVAAAVFAVTLTGAVHAETRQGPAEIPPASFTGNQYIDSKGCVFLRAEFAGQTSWAARLGRDRKPVCGYDPTVIVAEKPAAPAAEPAPAATSEPAAAKPAAAPVATTAAATKPAAPAAPKKQKRKAAPVAAKPSTLALVATREVGRDATYCPSRAKDAQRYLLSDGKRVTRCANGDDEAVGFINSLGVPGLVVSDRAPTARETRLATQAEQGSYRVTWVRGDLSPEGEAAFAAGASGSVIVEDGVPGRPVMVNAAPVATGAGPYVQIGAFADPANAERALRKLNSLGLPASVGVGSLKVVLAGPFGSAAEVSNALALLRQNGYRDAFPTRG